MQILIYLGVFVLYTNLADNLAGTPYIILPVVAAFFGFPLIIRLLFRREGITFDRTYQLMLVFLAAAILSTLIAKDQTLALLWILEYVAQGVLLYPLVVNLVRDRASWMRFVRVVMLSASLLGSAAILDNVTGLKVSKALHLTDEEDPTNLRQLARVNATGPGGREVGPIGGPNRFAQILIVLIPLGLCCLKTSKNWTEKIVSAGALLLVLGGVLVTYSRGALLTLMMLAWLLPLFGLLRLRIVVIAGALGIILAPIVAPSLVARLMTLQGVESFFDQDADVGADSSMRGRMTEMLSAFNVFLDHPIIGVGPGQYTKFYSMEYQSDPKIAFRGITKTRRAHCLYLEMAAETGLLGLSVFGALMGFLILGLWEQRRRWLDRDEDLVTMVTAAGLSVVAYLGTAVFLHLSYQRYFWFLVAIAGSALVIARDEEPVEEEDAAPAPITSIMTRDERLIPTLRPDVR